MDWVKQNKVFVAVLAVLVSGGLAGLFLSSQASVKIGKSERQITALENRLQSLLATTPLPSEGNLERIETSLEGADERLSGYLDRFSGTASLRSSDDAVVVLPRIQGLIVDYRRLFEGQGVEIGTDEAFGFARYQEEVEPPPRAVIPLLDKQLQVLSPVLEILAQSGPERLVQVEREFVEDGDPNESSESRNANPREDIFRLDASASARVAGLVRTLAFRLTFTGYTDALRQFLNGLSQLEIPILVREVGVSQDRAAVEAEEKVVNGGGASPFSQLFGGGETEANPRERSERPGQKPIIENNLSEFTVVLEFVELNLEGTGLDIGGSEDAG